MTSHGQHSCCLCPKRRQPQDPSQALFPHWGPQMCRRPQAKRPRPLTKRKIMQREEPGYRLLEQPILQSVLCKETGLKILKKVIWASARVSCLIFKNAVFLLPHRRQLSHGSLDSSSPPFFGPTEEAFICLTELTTSIMRNICSDAQTDVANACAHIPSYTPNLMATGVHCCHHIKNTAVTRRPGQRGTPGSHF